MLKVEPIKAFSDNYIWLVTTNQGSIVVDPGESSKICKLLNENSIDLKGILITHHHFDHTDGISDILKIKNIEVYGPSNNINTISKRLKGGDSINIIGINFKVIEVPGHTLDHIAFHAIYENFSILFCGDTLFCGGCGRVFEGTYEQMHNSLKKISTLPINTKIYCGHEYTESNLFFATEVEPENKKLTDFYNEIKLKRQKDEVSLPTTLQKELDINPFLRCNKKNIQTNISEKFNIKQNEADVFAAIRKWKDNF